MTSPSQSSLPFTEPIHSSATVDKGDDSLPVSCTELVFTQDLAGRYLSFYWRDAAQYGLNVEQMFGQQLGETFGPVVIAPYLGRVRRVLEYLTPERFSYPFTYADRYLIFDLVISPLLLPDNSSTQVIVSGTLVHETSHVQAMELVEALVYPSICSDADRYQRLLNKVAWNIRRTLDLETIWQQTVDGLGEALGVSRCLICPYRASHPKVEVVAEYCQSVLTPLVGTELDLVRHPYLEQVLQTLKPVAVPVTEGQQGSILAVVTCYQDQPNGLIILYQSNQSRIWNEVEIELIREFADQVGTGIAHATLFAESQGLANELKRVNDSLMQKHQELEEAHQQAEEASRLKSEFLANTSHELRTPLNGMIGFLKLIMDGMADDPEEQAEFIQEAYRSAVHLLSIINDILDIAKIEAGKMQLDLNPVKLDDLLTDVENFTRTQAQQKQLSFEIRTPATRDEVILYGNYQRLLQVMLNLVSNAIKFTHQGGITITAEVIQKKILAQNQEEPGMVKISVADTGIGVSLEKQDKLFQSFSQVDGSRTRQYGGTGLGLAISQKLVEAMSGVVNFYSMGEGLGSTVAFTVPLYQDPLMIAGQPTDAADLLSS